MDDPFLGEIRPFAFGFPPKGWASCDGQLLPIAQNTALFSLLGTMYGGDGRTTFALPDLRGRAGIHVNPVHTQGERGGQESVTLTTAQIPLHSHTANCSNVAGTQTSPAGKFWAQDSDGNVVFNNAGGSHYGCHGDRQYRRSAASQYATLPRSELLHCFAGYFPEPELVNNCHR